MLQAIAGCLPPEAGYEPFRSNAEPGPDAHAAVAAVFSLSSLSPARAAVMPCGHKFGWRTSGSGVCVRPGDGGASHGDARDAPRLARQLRRARGAASRGERGAPHLLHQLLREQRVLVAAACRRRLSPRRRRERQHLPPPMGRRAAASALHTRRSVPCVHAACPKGLILSTKTTKKLQMLLIGIAYATQARAAGSGAGKGVGDDKNCALVERQT
eukprot:4319454-Pleurochrysis_carterae.AAC.1